MHFIVDCIDDITAAEFPRSGYELSEDYSDGEIHICHPELPEEMTVVSETQKLCFQQIILTGSINNMHFTSIIIGYQDIVVFFSFSGLFKKMMQMTGKYIQVGMVTFCGIARAWQMKRTLRTMYKMFF